MGGCDFKDEFVFDGIKRMFFCFYVILFWVVYFIYVEVINLVIVDKI